MDQKSKSAETDQMPLADGPVAELFREWEPPIRRDFGPFFHPFLCAMTGRDRMIISLSVPDWNPARSTYIMHLRRQLDTVQALAYLALTVGHLDENGEIHDTPVRGSPLAGRKVQPHLLMYGRERFGPALVGRVPIKVVHGLHMLAGKTIYRDNEQERRTMFDNLFLETT